jgi:hypothetical protein
MYASYDLSTEIETAQNRLAILSDPLAQQYADLLRDLPFLSKWSPTVLFADTIRVDYNDLIELPDLLVTDREVSTMQMFELMPIAGFRTVWKLTLFAAIPDDERALLRALGRIQTISSSYDALTCGG